MSSGFGVNQNKLSTTCFAEELCFIVGGFHLQEVSFVAAFEKASPAFRVLDEIKLAVFQLESVDIIFGIDVAAVEKELMRRDGKQGLGEFLDLGQKKILDILTGENDRGILFTHTFGGVTDILDSRKIGEEEVQLIDGGCSVPFRYRYSIVNHQ